MHAYDDQFFATADRTAAASADGVVRCLASQLSIRSVLDLGCGRGAWLAVWLAHGATDVVGVDGPYVDPNRLHIDRSAFLARDLSQRLSLGRQFDLVQSLEVAEHLDHAATDQFVDNLVGHGHLVMFSAAIPGQGGEHHVNEQPWEFWRSKFAARGFELFDYLRPLIMQDRSIFFWYRHNLFLFAHRSVAASLPRAIQDARVEPGRRIADYLPVPVRLRTTLVRRLPRSVVDRLARLKYQAFNVAHRLRGPARTG